MKKLLNKVDFWTAIELICWTTCGLWTLLCMIGFIRMADHTAMFNCYSWSVETLLAGMLVHGVRKGVI